MRQLERIGDQYRIWNTVSDTYGDAPLSRVAMREELLRQGLTEERAEQWLEAAEVRETWAVEYGSREEEEAEEAANNVLIGAHLIEQLLSIGWRVEGESEDTFRARIAALLVPPKAHTARDVRAWLRANIPAGHAVLYVHPLDDDASTLDMLTVLGGGISEELMLKGGYEKTDTDVRAAASVHNAKALMMQLYAPPEAEVTSDGVKLS